jgi:FkbM family methyltransferase
MKPREVLYLLGLRPRPRTYAHEVVHFDLAREGRVAYARWLHPKEKPKRIAQASVDWLRGFLSRGDVAIDIGAHTGDSTLPIALAVGPEGRVLALEPNPYVFSVLEENARLNRDKTHIVPLMFAATPADGPVAFEYSDPGFCNGGRHEGMSRWRHGHAFTLEVQGRNLERVLAREYADWLPRIRFIKVDAEGYDYAVLLTLAGLIDERRPYLMAEVFKHTDLAYRERLYAFFVDRGYAVYRLEEGSTRCVSLGPGDLTAHRHYDVFCVPGGGAPPQPV